MTASAGTIRVEAQTRWDALDLAGRLAAHHTYLVQLGDRRWLVCVRCEELDEALLGAVRATAERWAADRQLASMLRCGDRSYAL